MFTIFKILCVFAVIGLVVGKALSVHAGRTRTRAHISQGAGTTPAAATSPTTPGAGRSWWYWPAVIAGSLATIIGIALIGWFVWLAYTGLAGGSPSLANVADAAWRHWLVIVIVGVFLFVALTFVPRVGGMLRTIVACAVVGLLAVVPFLAWVVSPSAPGPTVDARSGVVLASAPKTEWPTLTIPPGEQKFIEHPSDMRGMRLVIFGEAGGFQTHFVYPGGGRCTFGKECPGGAQLGTDVENILTKEITVSYAYERS